MKIVGNKLQENLDGDDYIMLHKAQLQLICFTEEELRIGHKLFEWIGTIIIGFMLDRLINHYDTFDTKDITILFFGIISIIYSISCFLKRNKNIDIILKEKIPQIINENLTK